MQRRTLRQAPRFSEERGTSTGGLDVPRVGGSEMKRSFRALGELLSIFVLIACVLGICCGYSSVAFAETSPEAPAHEKTLTNNGDGTYTLSLSVTGAATSTTESNDINVLVIFDTSSSMGNSVDGGGTRRSNAIAATEGIATNLLGKNSTANPDAVQMALITFNSTATVSQGWTTSLSSFDSSLENSSTAYGTNWEAALSAAYSLANDGDPTYVIFVTDGQPTMSMGSTTISTQNSATYARLASTYARALVTGTAGSVTGPTSNGGQSTSLAGKGYRALYGIYAYGTEVDYLDDVVDFANGNAWSAGTGTRVVSNYYRASSTTALQNALTSILTSITTATSFQGVTITDGLTGMTQSTTVDGKASDFTYTITSASGEKTVVTLNDDGTIATIDGSATSSSKTLTDSVGNTLTLKVGDAFPGASNTEGTVTWDTSTLPTKNAAGTSTPGALLGGYTYTVSFVVWPSQDAYDLVAQLENGTVSFDDLSADQQAQIVVTDTGYGLKTNTGAEVAYTAVKTVTTNGTTTTTKATGASAFDSPDPIALASTTLTVEKAWKDDLNNAADRPDSITLEVTQDGDDFCRVTLEEGNDWTATVYIAPGIVVTPGDYGTDATGVLESGHAYSVSEAEADASYELSVTPVQPMINGTSTDDTTDLVDLLSNTVWTGGKATLAATNTLKGRLEVSKNVVGDGASTDDTFTFVIGLTDSEGNAVSTDTANTTLEYLVYDANGNVSSRGDIDGGTATVAITASQSILVVDIPTGTSYVVYEDDVPDGYKPTSVSGDTGTIAADAQASAAFTNTYAPGFLEYTTSYTVTKTWDDDDNAQGVRPDKLDVTLEYSTDGGTNWQTYGTATLEAPTDNPQSNTWSYAFENLPMFNEDGSEIMYRAAEDEPANYTGTTTVTPTHFELSTDATAITRVTTCSDTTFSIQSDGVGVAIAKLTTGNNYFIWTSKPLTSEEKTVVNAIARSFFSAFDASNTTYSSGNPATYVNGKQGSVTISADAQTGVHIDFTAERVWAQWAYGTITTTASSTPGTTSLTNTLETGSLSITKAVEADGGEVVPEGSTFDFVVTLTDADGSELGGTYSYTVLDENGSDVTPATATITSGDTITLQIGWKATITGIAAGTTYDVSETSMPDGFSYSDQTSDDDDAIIQGGTNPTVTVTNTYETTDVSITKTWDDSDDQDGIRPTAEDFAGMVTLKADNVEVTGVTPDVTDNGNNTYTVTFSSLPKTTSTTSASGVTTTRDIVYSIGETSVPTGYTTGNASAPDGGGIDNSHTPATTSVTATKIWDDSDNQDGIRADVTLRLAKTVDGVTSVVDGQEKTISATATGDDLTVTWTNLPAYESGSKITYSVTEDAIEGYSASITSIAVDDGTLVTITNIHTPEVTSATAAKVWDDNDDQDGIRPASVTLQLQKSVGGAAAVDVDGETLTLNDSNKWVGTIEKLPAYEGGKAVTYSFRETDTPAGYTATYAGDAVTGITVTNTHTPETTSVSGSKVWDDNSNQDGKRPTSVVITLTGTVGEDAVVSTASKTVTGTGDTWAYSFDNLPKYSGGELITYTVSETSVPDGYTPSVDGYTVTNTHTPEVVSVSGTKTWHDANDQDGKRPGEITVRLTGSDGSSHETTTNAAEDWKYSFDNLPKYSQGTEITYTLTEDAVVGYTPSYDGYDVTNSYTPGETSVSVKKLWYDGNDQDGIRPDSVTVQLYAGNDPYGDPVELSEDDGWTYTWTSLPVNKPKSSDADETETVVYTVRETSTPDGYASAVSGDATEGFTVTNTHAPATTSVSATKTWDDADDQDGIRPASITYHLLADGIEIDSQTVTADDGWSYAWDDLPANSTGTHIDYTVTEDKVDGYATSSKDSVTDDGKSFSFTNTHAPEVTEVSGTKTWVDGDDQDGIRPDSVTVSLLANGTVIRTAEATAENDWTYDFADLPKYSAGKVVSYSVEEVPVTGYQATKSGYDLTNTHVPASGDITVTKAWSDSNDKDGIRPASVTVHLYADGVDTGRSATLSADDSWTATFSGLASYSNGTAVTYSVVEDAESGYTAAYTSESAGSITVTNTHVPTVTPKVPDTGDSTATGMGILAIIGAATVLAGYRRRRDE